MERVILHSDLNNFYASVACLYDPALRGKPVAVAGDAEARHGIVLAKNDAAKRCGVATGNPLWLARQRCPGIIFIPPDYDRYLRYSELTRELYGSYTDRVEPYGLDECWLDVTESAALFGDGKRIADDITIMRDGTYVGTWPASELTTDQIIAKMVGRELTNVYPAKKNTPGEVIMEVKNLCSIHANSFQNVSFTLRKGEILGFGGLVGAQRTELMEGIFGIRGIASGEIYMHGKKLKIKHPIDAMNAGIGLITEDRRGNGIFGCLSIKDNVGVSIYNKYLKAGFVLDHKKMNKVVDDSIKKLSIKTPSMNEHISNLSGGNQQKVIISRWLANDPDVLIMDEPTRGIDVGAKHEIYEIMNELAAQGKAIIMISSEMSELLGMADRICVMCNGKITGEIDQPEEMTQAMVMNFATRF